VKQVNSFTSHAWFAFAVKQPKTLSVYGSLKKIKAIIISLPIENDLLYLAKKVLSPEFCTQLPIMSS